VAERPVLGFAGLLRQLRAEAGLTQEELAEASGLSPRSVSDLERGAHRTARPDTARLLADALGLAGPGARAVRRRGRHRSRSWPLQKSAFSSCRRWTRSAKAGAAVGIVFLSVWVCDRRAILGIALISAQQPDPGTHRIDVRRDDTLGRAADPTW
jgi:transcriptional regulator with XRE-family HTH domain